MTSGLAPQQGVFLLSFPQQKIATPDPIIRPQCPSCVSDSLFIDVDATLFNGSTRLILRFCESGADNGIDERWCGLRTNRESWDFLRESLECSALNISRIDVSE